MQTIRSTAVLWLLVLCASGCRDVREDPDYCLHCNSEVASIESEAPTTTGSPASAEQADGAGGDQSMSTGASPASSGTAMTESAGVGGQPSAGEAASLGSKDAGTPTATSDAGRGPLGPEGGSAGRAPAEQAGSQSGTGSSDGAGGNPSETMDAGKPEPPPPCGVICTGDTPVCDEARKRCVQCSATMVDACPADAPACNVDTCVQCVADRDCPASNPLCDATANRCVPCMGAILGSCEGATPACDDANKCVECSPGQTSACDGSRPLCEAELHRCVECLRSEDCLSQERPRCDGNVCSGCLSKADCRDPSSPVCDLNGACVQCMQHSDCRTSEDCDQNNHVCVPKPPPPPPGTKAPCERCEQDAECAGGADASCSQLGNFGKYCFQTAPAGGDCVQPFRAQSLPGKDGSFCVPRDSASCEALALVGELCPPTGCGAGGRCNQFCTIGCGGEKDCPAGFACRQNECAYP